MPGFTIATGRQRVQQGWCLHLCLPYPPLLADGFEHVFAISERPDRLPSAPAVPDTYAEAFISAGGSVPGETVSAAASREAPPPEAQTKFTLRLRSRLVAEVDRALAL